MDALYTSIINISPSPPPPQQAFTPCAGCWYQHATTGEWSCRSCRDYTGANKDLCEGNHAGGTQGEWRFTTEFGYPDDYDSCEAAASVCVYDQHGEATCV